jgi:hypothetical protein
MPGVDNDPNPPAEIQVAVLGPGAEPGAGTAVGLTPIHDPDAVCADDDGSVDAVARAVGRTGLEAAEIVVGYIREVAPDKLKE